MTEKIELVQYRDVGMSTFTYFWVNSKKQIVSPYFDNEQDATKWVEEDAIHRHSTRKDSSS